MEFPLVSIIVPMYNTAGCIARCVKSICAQTYKSIEILLLNDGSTDDTLAICRALAASDHRIALVDKTNTGAADTRNQGIALAHGKYIQFVDSDDWLAPDFTEKLVSAAEAHTADLVIAPFWMVYPENYVEHIRPWEKALQHVLQRNPPRTRAYGYLPAGVGLAMAKTMASLFMVLHSSVVRMPGLETPMNTSAPSSASFRPPLT